ncbi:MAG: TonB-dependent receptor domain-containing protein [bacterium]
MITVAVALFTINGFSQELASKSRRDVDLAPQRIDLGEALSQLKEVFRVHVMYNDKLVQGRTVPKLTYSADQNIYEVLEDLLAEYPITFKKIGHRTIALVERDANSSDIVYGAVEGYVSDRNGALTGVNVYLEDSSSNFGFELGAATDASGKYQIKNVPPGSYDLVASFIGYKKAKREVAVAAGTESTHNFKLYEDVLDMEALVVTGTFNPETKLESSVAVTTLNPRKIEGQAPQNVADLLKSIPGFYVESVGGENNNNLWARGIPADGNYRYVVLQEDGMPVFEQPELAFGNADLWLRVDQTIARVEAVRGGPSSIFASNAPGGIVNIISKTGSETSQGKIKQSLGVTYKYHRTDLDFGGPLSEKLRYHVGGFYRVSNGIRSPGFLADKGGQIKANMTYYMNRGYLRVNMKYLHDSNISYVNIPLQDADNYEAIAGFDPLFGTLASSDIRFADVPKPNGKSLVADLGDGINPQVFSFGGETFWGIGKNWTLKNTFKKSIIDSKFIGIFPVGSLLQYDAFARNVFGPDADYTYTYARGERTGEQADLTTNGLVGEYGWWHVTTPLRDFSDVFSISKELSLHHVNGGYYFSTSNVEGLWQWQNLLVDISDKTRALNLMNNRTGVSYTKNGWSDYGSFYNHYRFDTEVHAFFLNDKFTPTHKLTLDLGLRFETGTMNGWIEKTAEFDLGDEMTTADDNVQYGTGETTSVKFNYDVFAWSFGLNFKLGENAVLFGRTSKGFRAPDDMNFTGGLDESRPNGLNSKVDVENIYQYETGFKYSVPNLAFFGTLFYSTFDRIPFAEFIQDPNDPDKFITLNETAKSRGYGLETEIIASHGPFTLNVITTVQDIRYKNWMFSQPVDHDHNPDTPKVLEKINLDGNQIKRIPKLYFTVSPTYRLGPANFTLTIQHYSDRFADPANRKKLPAYTQYNAAFTIELSQKISLQFNGYNLTNTLGIVEGDPRLDGIVGSTADLFYAKPIYGRSIVASTSYTF